jgi:uncharacterized protein YndB with AHSA1/START domain
MLKWIGGCLVLIIVFLIGGAWWTYRTMRGSFEPDGSVRVAIAATPERVFAAMANGDSVGKWMGETNSVSVSQPGVFIPGSHIRVSIRTRGIPQQPIDWIVREVIPNQLLVRELASERGQRVAVRRDSLAAKGDSTIVFSRTVSPMVDSAAVQSDKTKGTTKGGIAGATGDLMVSMFRFQSKIELESLKAHIEGKPLTIR